MFKKILLPLSILAIAALVIIGCSPTSASENQVSLGQEFTLPVGKSAIISGENMVIKFDSVIADSRSPNGAQTIWAGEARIQLKITYQGSISTVIITEKGSTNGYTQESFNQYTINFQLKPYPEVNKQPASSDYTLLMRISK